jgi:hypothetical protein
MLRDEAIEEHLAIIGNNIKMEVTEKEYKTSNGSNQVKLSNDKRHQHNNISDPIIRANSWAAIIY